MRASLIVAAYKDIEALNLIFETLQDQTYKDFEVIVAEDGASDTMRTCIETARNRYDFTVIHTTQEDNGVRKSHSQNNAIRAASGEYLIFIDGDCLPYDNFIENHIKLAAEDAIVTGRRVNLGPRYSTMLRSGKLSARRLQKRFLRYYFDLKKDASEERHSEEGFSIRYGGIVHKLLQHRKKKMALLGCNMSMYKSAMERINGFDEALGNSAYASDADLQWRFEGLGYRIVSGRFLINQFHLYHKRSGDGYNRAQMRQIEQNQKERRYVCARGIETRSPL